MLLHNNSSKIRSSYFSFASSLSFISLKSLTSKILRFNSLILCFFVMLSTFTVEITYAERFFQTHNTWYEKIPANPVLNPNSANYVDRLRNSGNTLGYVTTKWSVPILACKSK